VGVTRIGFALHLRIVAINGGQVTDVVVCEQLTGLQIEMQLSGNCVARPDQSSVAAVRTWLENELGNGVVADLKVWHPAARRVNEIGRCHISTIVVLDAGHKIESITETK